LFQQSPHHIRIYIDESHLIIIIKIIIINWFTKCISTNRPDMQLENRSFIHNYQQNPPMHIYINPHNHKVLQISPMHNSPSHIFKYATAHQLIKCMQCSILFLIHVVLNSSKVVTSWCNKNIIINGYSQWQYGYKYSVNDNMDITSDTTYDAWKYDSIHHAYVHNNSTAIINGYNHHPTISYSSISPHNSLQSK
jgi:hypothetical protein